VDASPAYVIVGRVLRPHGIRGELRVAPETDFPERLAGLHEAVLLQGGRITPVHVERARPHGREVLVKLAGIDSMDQAERWRGAEVAVPRREAAALPEGRHYVFEIIGLRVQTDTGEELGTVAEILRTGSNDVYVVRGAGREYLIPAISTVIARLDPAAGLLVVRPLPGMLE